MPVCGRFSRVALALLLAPACVFEHGVDEAPAPPGVFAARAARAAARVRALRDRDATTPAETGLGEVLGSFRFTYYWVAHEEVTSEDTGPATVQLYHRKQCVPLALVSPAFAERLEREGTGKLRDGRVVNIAGPCGCGERPCFYVVPEHARWGVGVAKRPLSPFRSVAVDPRLVSIGTMLYIPELDGLTMPGRPPEGGFVHDGCVVADDRGGSVKGQQIDFFTAQRSYYASFDRRHRLKTVTVFDGAGWCSRVGRKVVAVDRNTI